MGTDMCVLLHMQGIETVRRDNCLLVRNVVTVCLEKMMIERNVVVRFQCSAFCHQP
jgi:DNA polymerase delta subunit 1